MPTSRARSRTWKDNADLIAGRRKGHRMNRTWQDNADEFGRTARGEGGWWLAVLVACSVEPGTGSGARTDLGAPAPRSSDKVSATEFAQRAGVNRSTVIRYFDGWPKAIAAGAEVPPATDLGPDDVGSFPIPARPFNGPGG